MIIMMVIFISTANHATVRSAWRISIFRASNCRKVSIPTPSPSSSRENALSVGRGIAESNAYSFVIGIAETKKAPKKDELLRSFFVHP